MEEYKFARVNMVGPYALMIKRGPWFEYYSYITKNGKFLVGRPGNLIGTFQNCKKVEDVESLARIL